MLNSRRFKTIFSFAFVTIFIVLILKFVIVFGVIGYALLTGMDVGVSGLIENIWCGAKDDCSVPQILQ